MRAFKASAQAFTSIRTSCGLGWGLFCETTGERIHSAQFTCLPSQSRRFLERLPYLGSMLGFKARQVCDLTVCEVAGGGAGKVLSGDTETRDADLNNSMKE